MCRKPVLCNEAKPSAHSHMELQKNYLEAGLDQQGTPGSNATRSPTLKPLTSSPISTTVLQPN